MLTGALGHDAGHPGLTNGRGAEGADFFLFFSFQILEGQRQECLLVRVCRSAFLSGNG